LKLRRVSLHNVRRFTGKTAVLGPFGDGLTTITAENESGKSTFFDALHALFFHDYGSGKKDLKEMQPYAGGAMRVSAEVEIDGVVYLIEKVFNLKKAGSSATITSVATGVILKQADDAEQWIQQNILTTRKGPVGLLWVRQGTVGLDADAKNEPDGINARRDVMSSVRGQIDAVTGGRRMDSIVQRCRQELDAMSTRQDKPKAGSQWKEAEDQAASLREERLELVQAVEALSHDLGMKKRTTARLHELKDPALRQQRAKSISETLDKLTAAREHDRKVQHEEKTLQLLLNEERELDRDMKEIKRRQELRASISHRIKEKRSAVNNATLAQTKAQNALNQAQRSISDKEEERRNWNDALILARQSERQKAKWKRLTTLHDLFQRLREPKNQLVKADEILGGVEVKTVDLDRMSELERRRDIAIEKRKIHFSSFVVHGNRLSASIDGKELPNDEPLLIDHPLDVSLPEFGSISLRPAEGAGQGIENPATLQEELDSDLSKLGFDCVRAARQALDARQKALQEKQTAQTQIRALAPDGLDALEKEWGELCKELGHRADEPVATVSDQVNEHEQSSQAAEKAISDVDEELDELRKDLPALQEALTKAVSTLTEEQVLLNRLCADEVELSASVDEVEKLRTLEKSWSDKAQKVTEARAAFTALQESAPDLSAAEAAYERAVQADEQDTKEINRHERELARLNGAIQTRSEGAVEEHLAEVKGKLASAEERAAQFASHAKALKLLISHLEAARADAQETYFEPIRNELLPLLRQLHAGAEFQIDPEKLLIETITRDGVTDKVDVLSGGAYEQIVILTRLAFAKLFAKQGYHVPIILDDAMIHTDDERISTMFNLLSQIARDQQIIVLSCRTRAFSDLGGERAFITETGTIASETAENA
jgi:chromosome segregation ATPase